MAYPDDVIRIGEGFWNLRGSFKVGPVDIGTQASLVALEEGGHVLLDGCELSDEGQRWLDDATDGGASLKAVLHLHPFHTVFVRRVHERYPNVPLHGTKRHHPKAADLPWDPLTTDDPALHARFPDLDFSVPAGVAFIPDNENLHFASVLAFHERSKTLHVDDTLMAIRLPKLLRWIKRDVIRFHPTLKRVLEPREGAANEFRAWAQELIARCAAITNLCAAHSAALQLGEPLAPRVDQALTKVEGTLRAHEKRYG
jgi:hypothetical protein